MVVIVVIVLLMLTMELWMPHFGARDIHSLRAIFITRNLEPVDLGEGLVELRGPNYGTFYWGPAEDQRSHNNVLRLFPDESHDFISKSENAGPDGAG